MRSLVQVNYNGFEPEKKKKPEVSEVTIDPAELGLDSGLRVSPTSGSNTELSNSCDLCLGKAFRISLFGEERDNKLGHADMLSLFVAGTAAIAQEKCQKIVKEQEFKIRKLKEKMAGIAPTKKNKAWKLQKLLLQPPSRSRDTKLAGRDQCREGADRRAPGAECIL